jgi:hypothetical protein
MNPLQFLTACAQFTGAVLEKLDRALEGLATALASATALVGSLVRLLHTGRVQQEMVFALVGIAAAVIWLAAG